VRATRTFLELDRPRATAGAPAQDAGLDVRRAWSLTPAAYRALYAAVGAAYHWHDRDAWDDARLAAHLADPRTSVWVLHVDEAVAGYFELVRDADGPGVTLQYFGLTAAHHGRGLGRRLLERAIAEAWRTGARRLTLDTCTLDHPAALPNYLARGFRVVRTEEYEATARE
jgi:GNAT superfamily N-acetyltransferase